MARIRKKPQNNDNRFDPVHDNNESNLESVNIPKPIWKRFADAFQRAQKTRLSHKKAISILEALFNELGQDEFLDPFLIFFRHLLVAPKTMDTKIQLAMDMITIFLKDHPTLAVSLIERILHFHRAKDDHVRIRVCQLVHTIFDRIPDTEVDYEVYKRIASALFERAHDKKKGIRAIAVESMHRLQSDDKIIKEYIRILEFDSAEEVRCAAIRAIRFDEETSNSFLQRVNDTNPKVRLSIYQRLEKISLRKLPQNFVQKVIEKGLTDLNDNVVEACKKLLRAWLTKRDDNIPNMIHYFQSPKNRLLCEKVIITLIEILLKEKTFDNSKLWKCLDLDQFTNFVKNSRINDSSESTNKLGFINHSTSIYWRVCLDYFTKKNIEGDMTIDAENFQYESLKDFLELLPTYQSNPKYFQVARELILMIKYYDTADPVVSENAVKNISSALTFIFGDGAELVQEYIEALEHIIRDEDTLRDTILSIVSSIREKSHEFSEEYVNEKIETTKSQYDSFKKEFDKEKAFAKDYAKSMSENFKTNQVFNKLIEKLKLMKEEMKELKNSLNRLYEIQNSEFKHSDYTHLMIRIASIISSYLQNPKHRDQVQHLRFLLDNLVMNEVQNQEGRNPFFIKILSQFSALDIEVAKLNLSLFLTMLQKEEDVSCCIAWIKGVSDIIVSHTFQKLEIDQEIEDNIIFSLLWFTGSACSDLELRTIGTQALIQICLRNRLNNFHRRIVLTQIFSQIHINLDKFYQNMVRVFFKSYPTKEKYFEFLIQIIIPSIRRASIFNKETIEKDKRIFYRDFVTHIISSINPENLQNKLSRNFREKLLISKLLLMILFEIEIESDKTNAKVILKTVHSLLQFTNHEISKENHIFDYILHEIHSLENIFEEKNIRQELEALRNNIYNLLKSFEQPERELNENEINLKYSLSTGARMYFEELKRQFIESGQQFYENQLKHEAPLQLYSLIYKEITTEIPPKENVKLLTLPLYQIIGTTDSSYLLNDDEEMEDV